MKKNGNYIFIVEGETEKALVRDLFLGKVHIFNLWNIRRIEPVLRLITSNAQVFIIYDTDDISQGGLKFFIDHINRIRQANNCKKIFLVQQTHNFENELTHACTCNEQNLFNEFKTKSARKFKTAFNNDSHRLTKLNNLGFNPDLLWTRGVIEELNKLQKHKITLSVLQGIKK